MTKLFHREMMQRAGRTILKSREGSFLLHNMDEKNLQANFQRLSYFDSGEISKICEEEGLNAEMDIEQLTSRVSILVQKYEG